MKNFIKFIGFTFDNGTTLFLLGVILFGVLFYGSVDFMLQCGIRFITVAFALINLFVSAMLFGMWAIFVVKDFHDFKGEEYRRRMECLINSGEWAKI